MTSNQTRQVFGDTETTGFDPGKGDRVVETAFIEAIDLKPTGRVLHFYSNPGERKVGETENVHGLSDAFLAPFPPFAARAREVVEFLDGAVFIAHNAPFDVKFLEAELALCGLKPTWGSVEDSLALARRKLPGCAVGLDALLSRFKVDASKRVKHGALIDTELLIEVYAHLTGRTTLSLEPAAADAAAAPVRGDSALLPEGARQAWFPVRTPVLASDVELVRHFDFVEKKLKNALWISIFAKWAEAADLTNEA